jgi:23S rRNA pseudouridine1911/1915/1917 synthase
VDEASHHSLTVDADGERLDRFVARCIDLSRSRIAAMIRGGQITLNGHGSRPSHRVSAGDLVDVAMPPPQSTSIVPQDIPVSIVHEDASVIVVDKSAGLVVHPGRGNADGTLCNALIDRLDGLPGHPERPGIVHRLDKGTSGVMVVARTGPALAALAEQFSAHTVERRYLALVWGQVKTDGGILDASLARHPRDRVRFHVQHRGKRAVTHWKVVSRASFPVTSGKGHVTLVRCRLETGRTHQVRVHLSHLGHPVVGDPVYLRPHYKPRNHLTGQLREAMAAVDHPLLHAEVLGFDHPETGKRMEWECPLPDDFLAVLDAVGIGGNFNA